MIEAERPEARPPRRISLVTRTLRPTQREIGQLQERLALIAAKKLFAMRKDATAEVEDDLTKCSELVARLRAELEVAVGGLPPQALADTRLADTRQALDRARHAISSLARSPA